MDAPGSASVAAFGWSPAKLGPVAWYYAADRYVNLNGTSVVNWNDRMLNGGDVVQSSPGFQPTWEPVGSWDSHRSSIRAAGDTLDSQGAGLAPVEYIFSGTGHPFSALVTCQVLLSGTQNVCKWTGSGGVHQTCIITSSNFLSLSRSDGAITETITDTTTALGTGHLRIVYTFDGQTGKAYLGFTRVLSGTVGLNVGATTFTQFTVGDVRDLRYTEVVLVSREIAASEVALYNAYSIREWGT